MISHTLSFVDIYPYITVFTRIAPMMVVLPIFSDLHIPQTIRLALSMALSIIVFSVVSPFFPVIDPESPYFFILLGGEVFVGLCLGLVAKIWFMALQVVANIISTTASLSNATLFNPSLAAQDTVIGTILLTSGALFMVLTDLHYHFIEAMIASYKGFPVGGTFILEDFSKLFVQLISQSFTFAVQLSMPFLIMGLVFQVTLGFLNRLMPQLQIFFIAMPAQILGGIALIGLTLGAILTSFNTSFESLPFYERH